MKAARLPRAVLAALAWCVAVGAQAPSPAFVEVELPQAPVVVGQRVPVVVRIGYDAAFFAARAIPWTQQRLDVPFHLVLPWFAEPARAAVVLAGTTAADAARLAVGDRIGLAVPAGQRAAAGVTYALLELLCYWTPLAAGPQPVPPAVLRWAFTTRFEDHLLSGRQPVDRHEATAMSAAGVLDVRALPPGKPAGCSDAVGTFAVDLQVASPTVRLGAAFALTLTVTGDGDLQGFAAPPWPPLPGFVVQGLVERRSPTARTLVFDVLPVRPTATAIGPLPFGFFDPAAGAYRTLLAGPVPLRVLPAEAALPERVEALVRADAEALAAATARPWWAVALPAAAALAAALFWGRGWRARATRRAAAAGALRDLAARLPEGADAACAAFAALCAVCAGTADAEPDFAALQRRGMPAAVVADARALHAQLVGARFGGVAPAPAAVLAAGRALVAAMR